MARRHKVLAVGALAAVGGVAVLRTLARARASSQRRLVVRSENPLNLETPLGSLDRLIIPNDEFFVRNHLGVPPVGVVQRLRVGGRVREPLDLTLAQLQAMPQTTVVAVLQCAGNGRAMQEPRVAGIAWEHGAAGQASWTGVPLADLLRRAGVDPGARHVALEGADVPPARIVPAYHRSIPLERALDPTTIVALRMNDEPLPHAHGAPFRLVVPGWAGDHWMKWLHTVRVQEQEAEGHYMQAAYRMPRAPVVPGAEVDPADTIALTTFPVKSTIARPLAGSRTRRGVQEIVGVAYSGAAPVATVEVSLDGGVTWHAAELQGEPGTGRWQVFRHRFRAVPGRAKVTARATDARGHVQPRRARWNPHGYFWNGWHTVAWDVV